MGVTSFELEFIGLPVHSLSHSAMKPNWAKIVLSLYCISMVIISFKYWKWNIKSKCCVNIRYKCTNEQ